MCEAGKSRKASVSRRYSRNSSGRPSAATVINAAGIRNVANVTSATQHEAEHEPERACGTGAADAGTASWPTTAAADAHRARRRRRAGATRTAHFRAALRQMVTAEPAELARGNVGLTDPALHRGRGVLVGRCVMRSASAGRGCCGRGCRRPVCRGRSPGRSRAGVGDRVTAEGDVAEARQPRAFGDLVQQRD